MSVEETSNEVEPPAQRSMLSAGLASFTIVACLMVWVMRRPAQLVTPYIWAEESVVLKSWLEQGWSAAFNPLQGYFAFPSSLLIVLGAELSAPALPVLEYVFATAVFLTTVALLLVPDSRWGDIRVRSLMAIALVLVPCNPEVFGVLLYSFWWAALWPVIILGWRRPLWSFRLPLLAIGALSSPAGCAMAVVFALAWLRERSRVLLVSTLVLGLGAVLQVLALATSGRGSSTASKFSLANLVESTARTGGLYVGRWTAGDSGPDRMWSLFLGMVFAGFVLAVTWVRARRGDDLDVAHLAATAVLLAAVSQVPEPMVNDPIVAGPRYHFLPYALFAWFLICVASRTASETLRNVCVVVIVSSLVTLGSAFSRSENQRSFRMDWHDELRMCADSRRSEFQLPIMLDGSEEVWTLPVRPEACRRMLA